MASLGASLDAVISNIDDLEKAGEYALCAWKNHKISSLSPVYVKWFCVILTILML